MTYGLTNITNADLTSDFQRRVWMDLDVTARLARLAGSEHRYGSAHETKPAA